MDFLMVFALVTGFISFVVAISMIDEGALVAVICFSITVVCLVFAMMQIRNVVGHAQLGSLGHTCFANRTCRGALRCADDGGDGTCVK